MSAIGDSTDEAILIDLGRRIARHRLNRNLTQADLANEAGLSTRTLHRIEHGHSTQIGHWIRLLRVLDLLENLEGLVPEPAASPIQQLKLQGKRRRRASSSSKSPTADEPWTWGDEE